jgi:hypothetical protein
LFAVKTQQQRTAIILGELLKLLAGLTRLEVISLSLRWLNMYLFFHVFTSNLLKNEGKVYLTKKKDLPFPKNS